MRQIQADDLTEYIGEAIRDVQEGETIEVTKQGEVVAMIVPARRRYDQSEIAAALAGLDDMAAEIGKYVTEPTNVAEVISESRR